jgi:Histone methyltransferase Tudor domain 1
MFKSRLTLKVFLLICLPSPVNKRNFVEWYRSTITYASANRVVWDVVYDDGEKGVELCRTCIRPFIPYELDETLDVRISSDQYASCRVVAIHSNQKEFVYDVELDDEGGKVLWNVPTKDVRRRSSSKRFLPLALNSRVMALYRDDNGNEDYYPGVVEQFDTVMRIYVVRFDDGDYSYNLKRSEIELL